MTFRIEGETLIGGKRYFKHITSMGAESIPGATKDIENVRYYRHAPDGIYFISAGDPNLSELLEMPLPIPVGTKWLTGTTEARAERVAIVKASGRKYADCLKVTYAEADGIRTTEYYLAPGVGIVKSAYTNTTPPKSTIEMELIKYKL